MLHICVKLLKVYDFPIFPVCLCCCRIKMVQDAEVCIIRISEAVDCFVDDAEEVAIAGEHLGMKMISIEPH